MQTSRLVVLLSLLAISLPVAAKRLNGFELDDALVPPAQIVSGGPPRDGIPALTYPRFVSAAEAEFLEDGDRVLGVTLNGESRAYPIRILNWHELVNDRIGQQYFVVSYCPLCGSGMVFAANAGENPLVFGVSGLLYNSDVLLYDRNTESLWSQIMAQAISGPLAGTRLPQLPATHTSWAHWRMRHPDTLVLSTDTGYRRDYRRDPYRGYERSPRLYFKVANKAPKDYHPKELVLGISVTGTHKAYPFSELRKLPDGRLDDRIDGLPLTITFNAAADAAEAWTADGRPYPATVAYWFAWYAFHPDTMVFRHDGNPEKRSPGTSR